MDFQYFYVTNSTTYDEYYVKMLSIDEKSNNVIHIQIK